MPGVTLYPGANTTAQWFNGAFPGVVMGVTDKFIIHTTEGSGWPSYSGGAAAPTFTVYPDTVNKKLVIRQHFPLDTSSRALVHPAGTPQTNNDGVIQAEFIGTCDPSLAQRGVFFWPQAPKWALDGMAEIIATLHTLRGIPLTAWPKWNAYPASAGNSSSRMSWAQWAAFSGVAGHQHVPGNDHGDPGNIDINYVMAKAHSIIAAQNNPDTQEETVLSAEAQAWIEERLDAHTTYELANRQQVLDRLVTGVKADVASVKADVASVKADVAAVAASTTGVSKADFDALNVKVDALLSAVSKLGTPQ